MFRDENDAGYATLGKDPANGLDYIIDFRTRQRVYQMPACITCGCQPWSSVPEPTPCLGCIMDRARKTDDARS